MPAYILEDKNNTGFIFKRKRPPVLQYTGDYTKVGSPTIVDNVVSGFSASNYLQLPKTFNGNVGNTWEMVWKFRLNSDYTSAKDLGILAYSSKVAYCSAVGVVGTKKIAYVNLATNTSGSHLVKLNTTTTLEPETDYWLKAEFTGTAYNLYLSTNGTNYNLEATKETTSKWTSYTLSNIGLRKDNVGTYPFKGSIDLTESYIKVDGAYWWRGAYYANADKAYVLKKKQYWKKVVTEITKYWKEIKTETTVKELAFACYGLQHIKLYAKLPLGSDRYIWATNTTGIATSVSQLKRYPEVFGSISESVATWGGSYPRDYAHDVYKDVTTTVTEVVEGTPDDYTYTETETIETNVKATKDDYDFIIDKAYVLRRK